jgi:hypothetical protein
MTKNVGVNSEGQRMDAFIIVAGRIWSSPRDAADGRVGASRQRSRDKTERAARHRLEHVPGHVDSW